MEEPRMSGLKAWALAVRPRTLPAAVGPVAVGTAQAAVDGGFAFGPALAALAGALLLQVAVNLANDYFDFRQGIDTPERLGPVRVTQSGLIPPERVFAGLVFTLVLATAVGAYLILAGGWPILLVGIASILSALAYSGGPYPLASHALGDLFVFLFFGPVAVCGTYYVQTLTLTLETMVLSVPVGFLITAILVVNNLRDIPTDTKTGKRTLAVVLGPALSRAQYLLLLAAAYVLLPAVWGWGWRLLPFLSLPAALIQVKGILTRTGSDLNRSLAGTAALSLLFSLLLAGGVLLSALTGP